MRTAREWDVCDVCFHLSFDIELMNITLVAVTFV
jgi:hypothetical protein